MQEEEGISARVPGSIPGQFWVSTECMDCDLCRELAPAVFRRDTMLGMSFVFRQPQTGEEMAAAVQAARSCCVEAIRMDGLLFDWGLPPSAA